MSRPIRFFGSMRNRSLNVALITMSLALLGGCEWDSELFKRFREGAGPGFVEGATQSAVNPQNPDAGLRVAWAAFWEGIGGMIQPRSASSGG